MKHIGGKKTTYYKCDETQSIEYILKWPLIRTTCDEKLPTPGKSAEIVVFWMTDIWTTAEEKEDEILNVSIY